MKTFEGPDVWIHIFLISTLARGEWSASRPGRFTPGERAPSTHWLGGWLDPRAGLDDVEKRKLLTPRDSNFNPSLVQPVASRYTDYAIELHMYIYLNMGIYQDQQHLFEE
jgi:hypothetical protein